MHEKKPKHATQAQHNHEHLCCIEGKIDKVSEQVEFLKSSIGDRIMEAIQNFASRVKASFQKIGTSIDGVSADVTELKRIITEIQNSPGTLTPEDQASLDEAEALATEIVTRLEALDAATEPAVIPVPTP